MRDFQEDAQRQEEYFKIMEAKEKVDQRATEVMSLKGCKVVTCRTVSRVRTFQHMYYIFFIVSVQIHLACPVSFVQTKRTCGPLAHGGETFFQMSNLWHEDGVLRQVSQ